MEFQPLTEEQAKESSKPAYLLVPGECDFEVKTAEPHIKTRDDGTSSESIHLLLDVWDVNGKQALVHEYLHPSVGHKLRHACYAVGLGHVYELGKIDAEQFLGKGGRCIIRNRQDRGYNPKNEVVDYIIADRTKETKGYQNSKARDNGAAPPGPSPRKQAWEAFQAMHRGKQVDEIAMLWREEIAKQFPGKTQNDLTHDDWVAAGSRMRAPRQAVTNPIGNESAFQEDDIPF